MIPSNQHKLHLTYVLVLIPAVDKTGRWGENSRFVYNMSGLSSDMFFYSRKIYNFS
jgi:hypothetical protein